VSGPPTYGTEGYSADRTTDPWVILPSPSTMGVGFMVFSSRIRRSRVSRTWSVSDSTSSFGSPFLISSSKRYWMLSRLSPTIRQRSMSCCELRVRVNDLFSIPQMYGEDLDPPNVGGIILVSSPNVCTVRYSATQMNVCVGGSHFHTIYTVVVWVW
jgi:hypothetical protein